MSDYSFMKTGFNTEQQDSNKDIEKEVVTLVSTFANEGLKHASRYVEHHNTRTGITPEDVKRAMMLEVFLFNNRPDLLDKFEEIKELIYNSNEEEEEYDDEITDDVHMDEEFSVNNCDCAICKCMTTIYTRWAKWTPITPMDVILKKSIDNIHC
jgi:hypothetical protein